MNSAALPFLPFALPEIGQDEIDEVVLADLGQGEREERESG